MAPSNFHGLTVAAFESRMAAEMTRLIERHGGRALVAPALREIPLDNNTEAFQFADTLLAGGFDAVIFLTGVGARTLFDVMKTRHGARDLSAALGRATLVVRGPKPAAALKELGLTAQLTVPEPNTWRDVLATLDRHFGDRLRGLRLAVQDYGVPNDELLAALRQRGAAVTHVPVYRWALPDDLAPLDRVIDAIADRQVQVVLITNAVQIDHVMQVAGRRHASSLNTFKDAFCNLVVGSIGPTASERLRRHGLPVDFEPSHPKMGVLVKELSERAHELMQRKRATR